MENTMPLSIHNADMFHVTEAMIQFGGSFMSNLGRALRQADMSNRQIILDNWGEDIQHQYNLYTRFRRS